MGLGSCRHVPGAGRIRRASAWPLAGARLNCRAGRENRDMKHPASLALCAVVLCLLLCSSALLAAAPPSASELSPGWREKEGSTLLRFEEDRVFVFSEGQLQIASVTQRRPGTLVLRRNGLTEAGSSRWSPAPFALKRRGRRGLSNAWLNLRRSWPLHHSGLAKREAFPRSAFRRSPQSSSGVMLSTRSLARA